MNIKDTTSRQGVAAGLAALIVAGATLALPSAAVADQAVGDGCRTASYAEGGLDIDDRVVLRKTAMARAWAHRG